MYTKNKVTHLKDLWLHLCWSSLETRPVFPAHRTLSQAKYMALLRWPIVRQSLSTLSERWMALLAASSASTEFPRRSTVVHKHTWATILHLWCLENNFCFTHTFSIGSCVLPADWRFYAVQLLPRPSAACSPAECRHIEPPCEWTTQTNKSDLL